MTPHEQVDLLIRLRALELERPLPPDPYLRALTKATIALERAKLFAPELERKLDELEALASMYELVQGEARELLADMGHWQDSALEYALEAAREKDASPWPAFFAASRERHDVRPSEDPHE